MTEKCWMFGDADQRQTVGAQQLPVAPKHVLGVDQVLQHVSEQNAVEGAWLERRRVHLDVEHEDVVKPLSGGHGGAGVLLHTGDVPARVPHLEFVSEATRRSRPPGSAWPTTARQRRGAR